ncbi:MULTISPECIES: DUF302 domain-containing protein [Aeromicrobium]|uniref:DUF302 domain-containing protein n=1 Tax=Aeromicrobium phoceense TaxID=2754045 RepID=A0A838X8Q8_9ACTN|nr:MULTISPECIES: DUF302 domain-containing protein [Aeromicrobium]MBA4606965.1 DUF302 domain-containing protein [Aeromicrobium phoceense]
MTDFTLSATVPQPYEQTLERVRALLVDAGFGVLTEIDLRATLRAKLGVETPPRVILGACRPELAHRALATDPRIATLLPCNVVVTASGDGSRVDVLDPAVMTELGSSAELDEVAAEARRRLTGMMDALVHHEEVDDAARA